MLYNTRGCWVFGLFPSFSILEYYVIHKLSPLIFKQKLLKARRGDNCFLELFCGTVGRTSVINTSLDTEFVFLKVISIPFVSV
jgi:hypothetical protein